MKKITILIMCIFFSGCVMHKVNENQKEQMQKFSNMKRNKMEQVIVLNQPYLQPIEETSDNYPWLQKSIYINVKNKTLSSIMSKIEKISSVYVTYDSQKFPLVKLSLTFHGTIEKLLKRLSMQLNYGVEISREYIDWSQYETKIFNIGFFPGTSTHEMGVTGMPIQKSSSAKNNSSSGGNGGSGGSGGGGGGSTAHQPTTGFKPAIGVIESLEYSNNRKSQGHKESTYKQSILWQQINSSIQNMLSTKGFAELSSATTSLTVRDKPRNVSKIAQYIKTMNAYLSQQVEIVAQVYDVMLGKHYQNGINWNLVYNEALSNSKDVALGLTSALNPFIRNQTVLNKLSNLDTFSISSTAGLLKGSKIILNALSLQGKVITISQPRLTILNNQVGQINIIKKKNYVSQYASTATSFGSTSSVVPGKIITGFSLFILPTIKNDSVLLQLSSSMAKLTGMETINVDVGPASIFKPSGDDKATIQLPQTMEKYFTQRSLVKDGESLILSGFMQKETGTEKIGPFGASILGQNNGVGTTSEIVIIMTPRILRYKESYLNEVFHEYNLQEPL